ncbi:hypothetical protein RHECNPAF_4310053 [Rhizobium etli CNPAF512]|nr:hypothetical protein RHECNPAF_4310053 [Rhizobium etli CNPAF512]
MPNVNLTEHKLCSNGVAIISGRIFD